MILYSSFINDNGLVNDCKETTVSVFNRSATYNFIYLINVPLQPFSGLAFAVRVSMIL